MERLDVLNRIEVHIHKEKDKTPRKLLIFHDVKTLGERLIDSGLGLLR